MKAFFNKDDCLKYYKLTKTLGTGSFATVKLAKRKADGKVFAMKCIKKEALEQEDQAALESEVAILQRLDHPSIIKLEEVFDTPKTFYMVLELMSGGEIFDRIVEKEHYTEMEAATVTAKVAGALAYCHSQGVIHRDLKPENLLLSNPDSDTDVRIGDFGLAKMLKGDVMMQTACGTPGYVAPEILEGKAYDSKVDSWSMGVIAYILLCGFPPFYDENNAELFATIKRGEYDFPSPYWDDVSDIAKDFVNKLLVVDPAGRMSCEQMLTHGFLAGEASSTVIGGSDFKAKLSEFNQGRHFKTAVNKVIAAGRFASPRGAPPSVRSPRVQRAA
eukprot:g1310.t1